MSVGNTVFGDNEERFTHDYLEEALNAVWDQADPTDKVLTIWEGVVGPRKIYDEDSFADVNEVVNVKERQFKVLRFDECFEPDNFEEITED